MKYNFQYLEERIENYHTLNTKLRNFFKQIVIIYIYKIQCKSVCHSVCLSVCSTLETLFLKLFAKFVFHLLEQALGSVLVKSEFKYLK